MRQKDLAELLAGSGVERNPGVAPGFLLRFSWQTSTDEPE
jgi:hypothetical protein